MFGFLFSDNDGPIHDQFVDDASELFNERGYYKSNSVNTGSLTSINNYSGNLSFTKRLMSIPGPNGFDVNVDITYARGVQHIAANRYLYSGSSFIYYINHPEWIISVNGIAIQVLNFEDVAYNNVRGDGPVATNHELSMQVKGYHVTSLASGGSGGYERIYLLRGDGGLYSLQNERFVQYEGRYTPSALDEYYHAVVAGNIESSNTDRKLFLYPGDGTCIAYHEEYPNYTYGLEQIAAGSFPIKPKTFYLDYIQDQYGNRINFNYEELTSAFAPHSSRKFITSIKPSWGGYIYVDWWPSAHSLAISCPAFGLRSVLYGLEAVGIKGSYLTKIVDTFTALDWEQNINDWIGEDNYWPYSEDPQEHIYNFTYTSLGQRNYYSTSPGVPSFSIGEEPQIITVLVPEQFEIHIGALRSIQYENTGLLEEFTYITNTDNGIYFSPYPGAGGCAPMFKSDDYNNYGRDPFFQNMIQSRVTKDYQTAQIIRTEDYSYDWTGGAGGMPYCGKTGMETKVTIIDGQDSQNRKQTIYEYESDSYTGRNPPPPPGEICDQSAIKLVQTKILEGDNIIKRIKSTWDWANFKEETRKEYYTGSNGLVEYLASDIEYSYFLSADPNGGIIENIHKIIVTDNQFNIEKETTFNRSFMRVPFNFGTDPLPHQRNYYFNQLVSKKLIRSIENSNELSKTKIDYFTNNGANGSRGQIKKITNYSYNPNQSNRIISYQYFPLDNQSTSYSIYKGGELKAITDANGNMESYEYGERLSDRLKYDQAVYTRRYYDGEERQIEGGWNKPIPMPDNYFPYENRLINPLKKIVQVGHGKTLEYKLDYFDSFPTLLVDPNGYGTEIFYDSRKRMKGITRPGDYSQEVLSIPFLYQTEKDTTFRADSRNGGSQLIETFEFTVPHTLNYYLWYTNGKGSNTPNRVYLECRIYRPSTGEELALHIFDDYWQEISPTSLVRMDEVHFLDVEAGDRIDVDLRVASDNIYSVSGVRLYYRYGWQGARHYKISSIENIYNDDVTIAPLSVQSLSLTNNPDDFDPVIANDNRLNTTSIFDFLGRNTSNLKESSSGTLSSAVDHDFLDRKGVETDFNANSTTYEYDVLNRNTRIVNADSSAIDISYEPMDSIPGYPPSTGWTTSISFAMRKTRIDENDHKTVQYEDVFGQVRKEELYEDTTDFYYTLVGETFYDYDALGNRTKILNAEGQLTTFDYDGLGQLIATTHPDNGITKYRYDGNGNMIFKQDALRAQDNHYGWYYYRYDGINRLLEEGLCRKVPTAEPAYTVNDIVKKSYYYDQDISDNSKGRLAAAFDHESETATLYNYDYRGRIKDKTAYYQAILANTPMTKQLSLSGNGKQWRSERVTIDHNQTILYDFYRDADIVPNNYTGTTTIERNGTVVFSGTDNSGSYSVLAGDVVTITAAIPGSQSGVGSMTLHYIVNDVDQLSGDHSYTTAYTYNSADLITSITYPNGQMVDYTYDRLAQLESIPSYLDGNNGNGFEYNPNGAITNKYFDNGVQYHYFYNSRNWLERVFNNASHDFGYGYEYEPNGNLDRINHFATNALLEDFDYDELNRLTAVNYSSGQGTRNYSYDKVGNRIGMNSDIYNYTMNNDSLVNNQLRGINNSTAFQYDANGNLILDNDQGFVYKYDWNNRLKEVQANTWKKWANNPNTPYLFEVSNNQLHIRGNNNNGWKYAKKEIAPIPIAGSGDVIRFEFDFTIQTHVDMDYLRIQLEDSTSGTGFHINYYKRSNKLLVRQYHGGNVYSNIYLNTNMDIPYNTRSYVRLIIDAAANTVKFEYDRAGEHIHPDPVSLDQQITQVNSIKILLLEGDYAVDNIAVATTAYSPYTFTDNFDAPQLDGFAGSFVHYLYNTDDERVLKISPEGVTKYITDGSGQVFSEYDGTGTLKNNYVHGNGEKLVKLTRDYNPPADASLISDMEEIIDIWSGHSYTKVMSTDRRTGDYSIRTHSYESSHGFSNMTLNVAAGVPTATYGYIHTWVKPGDNAQWVEFYVRDQSAGPGLFDKLLGDVDSDGRYEVGIDLAAGRWNELWLDLNNVNHQAHDALEGNRIVGSFHAHTNSAGTSGDTANNAQFYWDDVFYTESLYTISYLHNDYLGSVRRISDETGAVIWSRDYYPFGKVRNATAPNEENAYTYEGKEKDLETEMWNNWKRHFNDEGRFTQVDPLWSKYPSLSPYVRVANNPLRFVDRDGQVVVDAVALGKSIYDLYQNPSWSNFGWMMADVVGAALPFIPAVGIIRHAGKAANAAEAGKKAARTVDVAKGVSVIGPKSTYREFAKNIGANFFNVADEAWTMRKNVKFLEGIVKRGDDVIFSGKFDSDLLKSNSILAQEIQYLQNHGYSWNDNFTRLIKRR